MQLTGLHISAGVGQSLALYKLITMQAADVNMVDVWGLTPLDHAVRGCKWACAVLLVSSGGVHFLCLHHPIFHCAAHIQAVTVSEINVVVVHNG